MLYKLTNKDNTNENVYVEICLPSRLVKDICVAYRDWYVSQAKGKAPTTNECADLLCTEYGAHRIAYSESAAFVEIPIS